VTSKTAPTTRIDLWSDEVLRDPYPVFAQLRELGPLVHLERHDLWAVTRHAAAIEVLRDYERFTSTHGVGCNDVINRHGRGILATDPPFHDTLRRPLSGQLSRRGLERVADHVRNRADELVATLVDRPDFDAVADLAEPFTVSIVAGLIGLPEADRAHALEYAEAAFTCYGPMNARTQASLPKLEEFLRFCRSAGSRANLRADGWGSAVYAAADRNEIPPSTAITLIAAYLGAGMDTTISAISSALMLLGEQLDAWQELRADRSLIGAAAAETLRLESPIQRFTRVATRDTDVDGVPVAAGERLLVLYGCANRDERRFPAPTRFDLSRRTAGHVAFGFGVHACAGQFLARLEIESVLDAMLTYVERFEVGTPRFQLGNMTRRLARLPVHVLAATPR
jgi:cytochrome P450